LDVGSLLGPLPGPGHRFLDRVLGGRPAPRDQREAPDQPGVDGVQELPDGDLVDQLTSLLLHPKDARGHPEVDRSGKPKLALSLRDC
jgi:hypothetical protein